MIEVTWELEGDNIDQAAAGAAVERVLNYYKRALSGLTCPAHGSEPWLEVRGSVLADLKVSLGTCCAALKVTTEERIRSISLRIED